MANDLFTREQKDRFPKIKAKVAVVAGNLVYINGADGWDLADSQGGITKQAIGIVTKGAGVDGYPEVCRVADIEDKNTAAPYSGLTPGALIYLNDTGDGTWEAGSGNLDAGDLLQVVGVVVAANRVRFDIRQTTVLKS